MRPDDIGAFLARLDKRLKRLTIDPTAGRNIRLVGDSLLIHYAQRKHPTRELISIRCYQWWVAYHEKRDLLMIDEDKHEYMLIRHEDLLKKVFQIMPNFKPKTSTFADFELLDYQWKPDGKLMDQGYERIINEARGKQNTTDPSL